MANFTKKQMQEQVDTLLTKINKSYAANFQLNQTNEKLKNKLKDKIQYLSNIEESECEESEKRWTREEDIVFLVNQFKKEVGEKTDRIKTLESENSTLSRHIYDTTQKWPNPEKLKEEHDNKD